MRAFYRAIRIFAVITLFFFCWTYLPLYAAVAYAATPQNKGTIKQGPVASNNGQERPEERFEKALEDIRQTAAKAEEITDKGEDASAEIRAIKAKRAEIESLDVDLKKEFAETEKKLKDAHLPKEILDRHYKFVKHYEDNLKELRANLDDVEQAKTRSDRKAKIENARLYFENVMPPRKHVPLDPNNLPNRLVKGKKRMPRLRKKDFEKDFPQRKKVSKLAELDAIFPANGREWARMGIKPVQLAFNGPTSDMPLQLPPSARSEGIYSQQLAFFDPTQTPELIAQNYLLAASALVLPTSDDLAETPDIQFTQDIQNLAAQLNHNPVQIYNWVRNNIEYAPTYGSIQGADQCLQSKICNDMDTASLLIALLRVSGIYAHYVYGTIQIPIAKAMNWVGGVTDPNMAGTVLATNGVPVTALVSGGTIKYEQIEHVWVKAYIDYIPSRGAVQRQGNAWIPLDASYKQYEYNRGMDLYARMGIKGEKYLMDYITDTSTLTLPEELQASFTAYTISPYQYYSQRLFSYLDANFPTATYQDILGADTIETSKAITKKEYPYLLGTLPYIVITQGAEYSSIPDRLRQKVNFVVEDTATSDASLSYTTSLPETAGKRITISFDPATSSDASLVTQYGALLNVPPYLINVKPVLKINGITVATGNPIGLGQEQIFNMTFGLPNVETEIVSNTVVAGDYSAIAIISQKVPFTLAGDSVATLINNIGSSDLDDLLGQMLYSIGVSYFHHLNYEEELYAKNLQMMVVKGLSEAMIISHAVTNSLFGVPCNISEGGIGIDIDKNEYFPFSYDGSQDRTRDFMIVSGLGSSAWEDRILQAFYDTPSVSAARLLRFASQQGVPIYAIDDSNISAILSQLQVSSEIIDDIRNAVNAGKKVIISKTSVQYETFNSIGYIIIDPTTGAAGFMISSGMAGGLTNLKANTSVRNVSQYIWGDGSALRTIYGRLMVVMYAMAQLDTIYKWGKDDPKVGFDCSGLVHYVFTAVYGSQMFGGKRLTASGQYKYLLQNKWVHPLEDKLDGDILWNDDLSHTGIYYGKLYQGEIVVEDTVIHATSSHFINGDELKKVVITYTTHPAFTGQGGSIKTDIGRPVPDGILVDIPF